jgi:hypothetical protein
MDLPLARKCALIGIQWLARLLGLALVLLVLTLVVGHGGLPNPFQQPPRVAVELGLMLIMTLGLVVALRWALPGAAATLAALAAINLVELLTNHRFAGGAFPLFALPPLLYVGHALLDRAWTRDDGAATPT